MCIIEKYIFRFWMLFDYLLHNKQNYAKSTMALELNFC